MADSEEKEKTELLRFRISRPLHAYLGLLARATGLGWSENEVARFILTERLQTLRGSNYHQTHKIPDDVDDLDLP